MIATFTVRITLRVADDKTLFDEQQKFLESLCDKYDARIISGFVDEDDVLRETPEEAADDTNRKILLARRELTGIKKAIGNAKDELKRIETGHKYVSSAVAPIRKS